MLEKIIQVIQSGGSIDIKRLAEELQTTPEMVKAMLSHLQRQGLLQTYLPCESTCQGCDLEKTCAQSAPSSELFIWQSKND